MEDTWFTRDLVALEAAVRFIDQHAGQMVPQLYDIAEMTGLPEDDVERAFLALDERYVKLSKTMGPASHWRIVAVTPEARRAVGQWPSPERLVERLVEALKAAGDRELDPDKKGRLRRAAEGVGGVGKDVLAEVIASIITRGSGLA